jgi:opacity protein-like surface antigen
MRKSAARAFGAMFVALLAGLAPAQAAKGVQAPSKGIAARSAEVDSKVADLTKEIRWYTSLDEAQAAAKKSGKPIFWMHMKGELTGVT